MKLFWGRFFLGLAGLWFILTFFMVLPFFVLFISVDFRPGIVATNWVWCLLFFNGSFLQVKKVGKMPNIDTGAVVVANHGSYFDIPVLTEVLNCDHAFLGKSSLKKIPLFGYMYGKLHILVDRSDRNSKKKSLQIASKYLLNRRLVVIFPEGTIRAENQPKIGEMKDGAFFLAVQAQVPLVPISLPYNWYIFPDDGTFCGRYKHPLAVIHPPISTLGMTEADVPALKQQVAAIFTTDLLHYNNPS